MRYREPRRAGVSFSSSHVSQGTVSRELSRNTGQRGYRFPQAQRTAQSRHAQVWYKPRKLTLRVRRAIARKLRAERWSLEQISFWLRWAGSPSAMNGSAS